MKTMNHNIITSIIVSFYYKEYKVFILCGVVFKTKKDYQINRDLESRHLM